MKIGNVIIENVIQPIKVQIKNNSLKIINSEGLLYYYNNNYDEILLEVEIKISDNVKLCELMNFIVSEAKFSKNVFLLEFDSEIDLGTQSLITVRYWSDEFCYEFDENGFYSLKLLFRLEE